MWSCRSVRATGSAIALGLVLAAAAAATTAAAAAASVVTTMPLPFAVLLLAAMPMPLVCGARGVFTVSLLVPDHAAVVAPIVLMAALTPLLLVLPVVQLFLTFGAHTELYESLLVLALLDVSKEELEALQRGIRGAACFIPAHKLSLAVKYLLFRAPAQTNGTFLVARHVRKRILPVKLHVVRPGEADFPGVTLLVILSPQELMCIHQGVGIRSVTLAEKVVVAFKL